MAVKNIFKREILIKELALITIKLIRKLRILKPITKINVVMENHLG